MNIFKWFKKEKNERNENECIRCLTKINMYDVFGSRFLDEHINNELISNLQNGDLAWISLAINEPLIVEDECKNKYCLELDCNDIFDIEENFIKKLFIPFVKSGMTFELFVNFLNFTNLSYDSYDFISDVVSQMIEENNKIKLIHNSEYMARKRRSFYLRKLK